MSLNSVNSSRPQTIKSSPIFPARTEQVIIPGIGVATQLPEGIVEVAYQDGTRISVKQIHQGGGVTVTQSNGNQYHYTAKDELPEPLRIRLTQMPIVLTHLMTNNMKNSPEFPACLYASVNKKTPQTQQQQQPQMRHFR